MNLFGRVEPASRVRRLKQRERSAWDRLVTEQNRRVYNLHLRATADPEAAADLTQETFVAAYESIDRFEERSTVETWLYGVALNCQRDWRRRQGRQEVVGEIEDDLPAADPTVEELALLRQRADVICEAVGRLPEPYRRTVALRYFAGVSAVEIAEAEGVEAGTIRWRLYKAIKKLWVMLQPSLGKEAQEDGTGEEGQLRVAP
ncbi:sigma-70 family RNA polymerase sigma factor [bacterium]|nr:sigma-70 family RNA polymerase sigma factor [bacterium]